MFGLPKLSIAIMGMVAAATMSSGMATHHIKLHEADPCFFNDAVTCDVNPFNFVRKSVAADDDMLDLAFAVKGQNDEQLKRVFEAVSDPDHAEYGNHLTHKEIGRLTSNVESTLKVAKWVASFGVDEDMIDSTANGDFLRVRVTHAQAKQMFATEFHRFTSDHEKFADDIIIRAPHVSLPADVHQHVDFVGLTTRFPTHASKLPPVMMTEEMAEARANYVVPALLKQYYGVGNSVVATNSSTQAVFESLGSDYSLKDLQRFFKQFNIPPETMANLIGPNDPTVCDNPATASACGEANLDVQYLMSMAEKAPTTFWSIEGPASKQAPFLDWIMQVANTQNPPLVHSVSYGGIEDPRAKRIFDRFNTEVMKMGARGLSVLVSSGDDGVANFIARADPSKCGFNPAYPASSPYVTAVGATQGPELGKKEIACCSDTGGLITTGGGVSNVFDMPDYQKEAVSAWKAGGDNIPPSHMFSQTGRVYPDVSMAGHNYVVALGGQFAVVSGTSASAPVLASFITLINGERLAAGKKPLGFLNPVLYKLAKSNPDIFNDVTSGDNKCCAGKPNEQTCCQYGFQATKGFDPTTGHGSPSFEPLKNALMKL